MYYPESTQRNRRGGTESARLGEDPRKDLEEATRHKSVDTKACLGRCACSRFIAWIVR